MNHLEGVVPIEKIHRIAAVRGTELPGYLSHPWFTARTGDRARTCAGAAGCVLSHARALQYALEHEDWQVILVLEDDARLDVERLERMTPQFQDFMHDPRWELLYVGYHGEPLYAGKLGKQRDFSIFTGVPAYWAPFPCCCTGEFGGRYCKSFPTTGMSGRG